MHADRLDKIDIKILELLQQNGRMKRKALAENAGLSIPSISERLRRLEQRGYIKGYFSILAPKKIELGLAAFVFVTAESSTFYASIIAQAEKETEIMECHAVTGAGSYIFKVRTRDTETLERLLSQIQSWAGIKDTATHVVLSSPKESTVLPLSQYKPECRKQQLL